MSQTGPKRESESESEAAARRLPVLPSDGAVPSLPPPLAAAPLETCSDDDRFHDYILSEYEPKIPVAGKLRSLNLLTESFALAGVEAEGRALMTRLRTELGAFRTVWGIKLEPDAPVDQRLRWELYFYDRDRKHEDLTIPRVAQWLAPHVNVRVREPRPLPWHMFSVEFGCHHLRSDAESALDVYLGMRSYKLDDASIRFENVYSFHDAKQEIYEVLDRLRVALHFDSVRESLASVLPPHLFDCHRICVANKRRSDALYFSRITTLALLRFLDEHGWPTALGTFAKARADQFDHLLWDVGVDYVAQGGRATPTKTGVYGTF